MAAVEEDMIEANEIHNFLEYNEKMEAQTPEDIAWADSCLIKDPEISDVSLDSLKDALIGIINSHSDFPDSSPTASNSFPKETGTEIHPVFEETETKESPKENADDIIISSRSKTHLRKGNASLPNYSYELEEKDYNYLGLSSGLGFSTCESENLTENIFRVWDFNVPAEGDEFSEQLNKLLTESTLSTGFDDSGLVKDLKDMSLDHLIAGIADLSLTQNLS